MYHMAIRAVFCMLLCSGIVRIYAQDGETQTLAPKIEEKLTIPQNASVAELEAFIKDIAQYTPSIVGHYSEYDAFLARRAAVIDEANDRILATDNLSADSKLAAMERRLSAGSRNWLDNPKAAIENLQKIIDDTKDDDQLESVWFHAQRIIFNIRYFSNEAMNREDILNADRAFHEYYTGNRLEILRGQAEIIAIAMLETASSVFAGDDDFDEMLDEFVTKYKSLIIRSGRVPVFGNFIRRCQLPGKEMEFQTVTIDVKKLMEDAADKENFDVMTWANVQPVSILNLKSLEGKVVLVDCWATWCGSCMAEVPNMMEQYEKYHEKGFEIIGYSCDQDINALLQFLIKEKPPWIIGSIILSEKEGLENYLKFYGALGIPTMILIGRGGKVIDINAKGQMLNKLLEDQFADSNE